jgi:hypothetical protein
MPPGIFDEVEERTPDAERGHCANVSSRSARVNRRRVWARLLSYFVLRIRAAL